jgi:hypothetical protein
MDEASLRQFDEQNSGDFRWLSHDARGKFSGLETNMTCKLVMFWKESANLSPLGLTYISYS